MRALAVSGFALFALCVADIAPACAADFGAPIEHSGIAVRGLRAAPRYIYDDQPGVVLRAYWRTPWRDRHYFPHTGEQPLQGREEVIPGTDREMPEPAERFFRMWSTSAAFAHEDLPEAIPPDAAPPANPLAPQNSNSELLQQRKRARTTADSNARVIRAEAEVRIMGRDQMSIELNRKGDAPPTDE